MNNSEIQKDWESRGYSFGIWDDPPGQRWENYTHPVDELFMLAYGNVKIEIEGKKHYPKIGEEIFIPAKAVHSVRNIGEDDSQWFYGYSEK